MRPGITEKVWNSQLTEGQRLVWGLSVALISATSSFFVTQSPYPAVNWVVRLYVVANAYLLVQPQRKYSGLGRIWRRLFVRTSLAFAAVGIAVLVCGFFGAVVTATILPAAKLSLIQAINEHGEPLWIRMIGPSMFLLAAFVAIRHAYQGLSIREIAFERPRQVLVRLIVRRDYAARTWQEAAMVELVVVAYSVVFASSVGSMTTLIGNVVKTL
ncbi:putative membrane protein [Burkholderia pseudomallei MSHR5613]|uniref:hypothetical protein n=1 Tax=Burkholderia pseudomallei TaxID=28450 RepID=UPI000530BD78|nr:hypothetical protein [Burkholderia pseudomallei]KGS39108.1 putative membrane protein [Burkholderia pseudomallei MSHR5613]